MRSYPLEEVRGILDQDLVDVRERPGSSLSNLINFNRCLSCSERVTNFPRFQYVSSTKKVLFDWMGVNIDDKVNYARQFTSRASPAACAIRARSANRPT